MTVQEEKLIKNAIYSLKGHEFNSKDLFYVTSMYIDREGMKQITEKDIYNVLENLKAEGRIEVVDGNFVFADSKGQTR